MASLINLTSSLVFIVLLVLSKLANVNAETQKYDDLPLEELEQEARLSFSFTNGNMSSVTFD